MNSLKNGVGAAIPEELPYTSYSHAFGVFKMVKITFELGQRNIVFQTLFTKLTGKQAC